METHQTNGVTQWGLALTGIAVLYAPTYMTLSGTLWRTDEHSHAPLIAVICAWLFWSQRKAIVAATMPVKSAAVLGWSLFSAGLLLQLVGKTQQVPLLEMASQIPLLAGVITLLVGRGGLRQAWFPLIFLLFMIPLPGVWLDAMTSGLKQGVSIACEELLYLAGFPVGRSGVMISIGPYQMLVADACSGLYSILSLSALGVLLTYLGKPASRLHMAIMLVSIIPIALLANLFRVMLLVLVTYYLGDAAGRSIHAIASPLVFVMAVALMMLTDRLCRRTIGAVKQ